MTIPISHTHLESTGPPLFIIHGVYGSGDNWASLGRAFAEDFNVYLLDMRNHGRSPWSEEFNYPSMAEDVIAFANNNGISQFFLLGHSMGGKVAMQVAAMKPNCLLALIVIDIAPKAYEVNSHHILLNAMNNLDPEKFKSRKDLDAALQKDISDFGVRQFLLKNIKRDENKNFAWKINLKAISNNINLIGSYIPTFPRPFNKNTLFIRGSQSEYITNSDYSQIAETFPSVSIINVLGAGHWVHADQPNSLYNYVNTFLQNN